MLSQLLLVSCVHDPSAFFKITFTIATWYIVLGLDLSVVGYLNSKQAAVFKRMIWEAMNKDNDKGKSGKRARMAKKAAPAKKPEKTVKVSTVMDTKNGFAPTFEEGTKSNCGSLGDLQLSNEKNSRDDEFEHESNGYSEEAEARQGQDDDSYVANDKYNGYNYDDECKL
ncbi:hypothetical protein ACE6H2_027209 [Prunus campanulata]